MTPALCVRLRHRSSTKRLTRAGGNLTRRTWIGPDDRGVELEIVAVVQPDYLLVIHVMPTHYRRRG